MQVFKKSKKGVYNFTKTDILSKYLHILSYLINILSRGFLLASKFFCFVCALRERYKGDIIMPEIPSLIEMLKSGVHFGHKKSRRHPKMIPYIFTTKNNIHIINLEKTLPLLQDALDFITRLASRGGVFLFVGTKKQAQEVVKKSALSVQMPFCTMRWLGGTLTNFTVISRMIKKYKKLKSQEESGELLKYTKKEQLELSRQMNELEDLIGGIQHMSKLPDALIIIDPKKDDTALKEALRKKIPVIAFSDTNVNPDKIQYPIPANDDAVKSIELILGLLTQAIEEGKIAKESFDTAEKQKGDKETVEVQLPKNDSAIF